MAERKLSEYFTWSEATHTNLNYPNEPEKNSVIEAIERTAKRMDEVREFFDKPVRVNSWYRSMLVNAKAGGAKNSAHLTRICR